MSGPVVVVTGASGGVGRAVARQYGSLGASVGLVARGKAGLDAAAEEVQAGGGQALVLPADVAEWEQVHDAARRAESELGPVDIWVNAAFASVFAPFTRITPADFRRTTEVSYLGFVHGTMAALELMRPRDRGVVVQVGSALAYRGIPLQSAYCGSKHAIQGFNESLRCELLHDKSGIAVTMVQLPAVNTPQFSWVRSRLRRRPQPVPPIYQPEVAARAIRWAADHPRRREYWVGGSTAATLLANAVVPGLLDRYLARTGYDSQQTEETQPHDPGNLWAPKDGPQGHDYGAHGRFDARSTSASAQLWATEHRAGLAAGALGAATALGAVLQARRGR